METGVNDVNATFIQNYLFGKAECFSSVGVNSLMCLASADAFLSQPTSMAQTGRGSFHFPEGNKKRRTLITPANDGKRTLTTSHIQHVNTVKS